MLNHGSDTGTTTRESPRGTKAHRLGSMPLVVTGFSLVPSYNRLSFIVFNCAEEFWPTTICGTGSKRLTEPEN